MGAAIADAIGEAKQADQIRRSAPTGTGRPPEFRFDQNAVLAQMGVDDSKVWLGGWDVPARKNVGSSNIADERMRRAEKAGKRANEVSVGRALAEIGRESGRARVCQSV